MHGEGYIHRFITSQQVNRITLLVHVDYPQPAASLIRQKLDAGGFSYASLADEENGFPAINGTADTLEKDSGMAGDAVDWG